MATPSSGHGTPWPNGSSVFIQNGCIERSWRDLELVPKPNSGPVNFFIYPYVEVDGKPLPQEHVELQFTYNDPPK